MVKIFSLHADNIGQTVSLNDGLSRLGRMCEVVVFLQPLFPVQEKYSFTSFTLKRHKYLHHPDIVDV